MIAFLVWHIVVALLGWIAFPLTYLLFPALADRGYALARAAGLLVWAYLFWLLASLGAAQNDLGGLLFALALLGGASALAFARFRALITDFIKTRLAYVLSVEVLFLVAFGFLAFARAANPELYSAEKPMELAFISGILRSPTFPPQDPWLSGYAISYYYFGYVMTAMLARISGINASMAHNLMLALTFGLSAIGSFGVLYNLLSRSAPSSRNAPLTGSFLAPLFLLLVSNLEAALEVLHRKGFFWKFDPAAQTYVSGFWTWLDMKELSLPPVQPGQWIPDRYLWWWRASRVIQDYDLTGSPREVIDEFPFFSFLLGDIHPHVLAIPFTLLAVAFALNLFLSARDEKNRLFGTEIRLGYPQFFFGALILGGLAFLNTWDILVAGGLFVLAYALSRARQEGWNWRRIEEMIALGAPLGFVSFFLYLPFYFGFSSQAGGILPNLMFVTRGAHLWVMWGTLLVPLFAFLAYAAARTSPRWQPAFALGLGLTLGLWAFSWLLGWLGSFVEPEYVQWFLASQGMTAPEFFAAASLRRLQNIGGLLTMLAVLVPALALLFAAPQEDEDAAPFAILLAALAALLVLAPEFVYLRDQFGYRINTVFKFYYQAWILWSMAAAYGTARLLDALQGWRSLLFRAALALLVFAGLLYPALGLTTRTGGFSPLYGFTLDDFDRVRREAPDEAAAIDFLRSVPNGVIVEAVGDSYSGYARVSAHTGLQTVLGWPGHEAQWRGSYDPQETRREDVFTLYVTARWDEAQEIIKKYNIRYIYVGGLERASMRVNEDKFKERLKIIFQQGGTTIYETPR